MLHTNSIKFVYSTDECKDQGCSPVSCCVLLQLWSSRQTSHAVCGPAGSLLQDCDIPTLCVAGMSGITSVNHREIIRQIVFYFK